MLTTWPRAFLRRWSESRSTSRLAPPAGLRVGGVRAHVNASLPLALERVADVQRHATDRLELEFAQLAVLEWAEALVVGAAGEQVAAVHGHDGGCELDQLRHRVLHVVG